MNARLNHAAQRETITVPPDGKPQVVCPLWPDCDCAADCVAGGDVRRAQRIFLALVGLAAAIGGGLILWSLR